MTSDQRGGEGGSIRPAAALSFATIGFGTLVIFGFGMTSLAIDQDVISTPGLGFAPGIVALLAALAVFAGALWRAIARPPVSYWSAAVVAVAAGLGYIVALWLTALITGSGLATATAAADGFVTSWFLAVLVATAAISAWCGVAMVRTRASQPRWPWEDEDE